MRLAPFNLKAAPHETALLRPRLELLPKETALELVADVRLVEADGERLAPGKVLERKADSAGFELPVAPGRKERTQRVASKCEARQVVRCSVLASISSPQAALLPIQHVPSL